ncbi:MAG: hypothetical protein GY833_22180 [Aestuariibacter sp.]|nr:hypothetical protein [Aestuariibacter sp.]|tara:strand:+ start:29984 stop:30259 length:276 start_codon:yes stop_codon:yes gene_type:complete
MSNLTERLEQRLARVKPNLSIFGQAITMELENYVLEGKPLEGFEREVALATSSQTALDLAGDDKDMRLNFTQELNAIREACLGALYERNQP